MDVGQVVVVDVAAHRHEERDQGGPRAQEHPVGLLVLGDRLGPRHDGAPDDVGDPPAVGAEPLVEDRLPARLGVAGEAGHADRDPDLAQELQRRRRDAGPAVRAAMRSPRSVIGQGYGSHGALPSRGHAVAADRRLHRLPGTGQRRARRRSTTSGDDIDAGTDGTDEGFATRAIHAGEHPDPTTHAHKTPIYATATFAFDTAAEKEDAVDRALAWEPGAYFYSRTGNPTNRALEEKIASLEGAEDCRRLVVGDGGGVGDALRAPGRRRPRRRRRRAVRDHQGAARGGLPAAWASA